MFHNCYSLITLDISNFNTKSVKTMKVAFYNCHSLISLDLSNFNTNLVTNMEYMFGNCTSLIYLNLKSFTINSNPNLSNMFIDTPKELVICVLSRNFHYDNIINDCDNDCFKETVKIIIKEKYCTNNCSKELGNEFEYNNICYSKCPDNTYSSSDNQYLCKENLNCEKLNKYYNYNKTSCIDEVPEGFYINDTVKNTIDKCHIDCKTCDKKFTDTNSNCNSCLNNKYLDLGNCVPHCINGFYIDSSENRICKCSSNIECKECSDDSMKSNLCISCNDGYYQKNDDIPNEHSFIKCYKNPEGYYLDNDTYKSCYSTCKNCSVGGDKNNNNCIECKSGYILDYNQNCQEICPFYYYYNSSNNYQCTEDYNCPEQQNKLIKEKKECIKNCKNDKNYKYEFNNICFKSCPNGTKISDNNNYLCEKTKECPEDMPYEDENNECTHNCDAKDFFNGVCKINNNNPTTLDDMIKNIREQLLN